MFPKLYDMIASGAASVHDTFRASQQACCLRDDSCGRVDKVLAFLTGSALAQPLILRNFGVPSLYLIKKQGHSRG